MSTLTRWGTSLWCLGMLSTACTGKIGDPTYVSDSPDRGGPGQPGSTPGKAGATPVGPTGSTVLPGSPGADALLSPAGLGPSPVRRLSREEYRQTVTDLLGIDSDAFLDLIPPDASNPFDNDASSQTASAAWIEGAKAVADRVAAALIGQPARVMAVLPCTPAGPADVACLKKFVETTGSRFLRRPLGADEVDRYTAVSKVSVADNNFLSGVELLVRAWMQNMEFLYRVEIGTPVAGRTDVVRLTPYETAARLSYLMWGSMPGPELVMRAAAGRLVTAADLRDTAQQMVGDPRARSQMQRMHAMWLNYTRTPGTAAIAAALKQETDALVGKVIFDDKASWFDMFTATSTFADDTLAKHYGITGPGPGPAKWIPYNGVGDRKGILSHGALLSNGNKFGDTSPVQRGLWVRRRLMCQEVPSPPPELAVAVDEPPKGDAANACKKVRYLAHSAGACYGCHKNIDPIGFGLEAFDTQGQFRTTEPSRPDCPIDGQGALGGDADAKTFKGPGELATRLIESGRLEACFSENLMRFVRGRPSLPSEPVSDDVMTQRFRKADHRVLPLLVDLASSEAFRYRSIQKEVTP